MKETGEERKKETWEDGWLIWCLFNRQYRDHWAVDCGVCRIFGLSTKVRKDNCRKDQINGDNQFIWHLTREAEGRPVQG